MQTTNQLGWTILKQTRWQLLTFSFYNDINQLQSLRLIACGIIVLVLIFTNSWICLNVNLMLGCIKTSCTCSSLAKHSTPEHLSLQITLASGILFSFVFLTHLMISCKISALTETFSHTLSSIRHCLIYGHWKKKILMCLSVALT